MQSVTGSPPGCNGSATFVPFLRPLPRATAIRFLEELLEMVGAIAFLRALLIHLSTRSPSLRLDVR